MNQRRYQHWQKPINVAPNSIERKKNRYKEKLSIIKRHISTKEFFFLTDRLSKPGRNEVTQSLERKQILKQIASAFSYSRIEAVGISNLLFKWETCNIFRPGGRHGCAPFPPLSLSLRESDTARDIRDGAENVSRRYLKGGRRDISVS